jgi:hypothetical protein
MSANDIQVAGTHYRTEFQHWDLVVATSMGYFEGQVSKYTTRHRKKNGLQDLEKALHFARKGYELSMTGRISPRLQPIEAAIVLFDDYAHANDLNTLESLIVRRVAQWYAPKDWRDIIQFIQRLITQHYEPVDDMGEHDAEAGPGYVNQDR